jgi:hypothetical protein
MGHDLILVEPSRRSDRYIELNIRRRIETTQLVRERRTFEQDVVTYMQGGLYGHVSQAKSNS